MKKIYSSIFLFVGVLLLSGCSTKTIHDQRIAFKDLKWNHFEPVIFKVDVSDIEVPYTLFLSLRYTTQIPYNDVPVLVTIKDPSGGIRSFYHHFVVKNENGTHLGEGMGDLWDMEDKIKEYFFFNEKGQYEFKINAYTQYLETACVMDMGLRIEKSKMNYNVE